MAQQTMRGIRLGAQSLESEVGVIYSARTKHSFQCPNGHVSELVLPRTLNCQISGSVNPARSKQRF
jgi:hypothetical protein